MEEIREKIREQFGDISCGQGRVICVDNTNNLVPYGELQKITARLSNGKILDSHCEGARELFGIGVYAVYREHNSLGVSIEQFVGHHIFSAMN